MFNITETSGTSQPGPLSKSRRIIYLSDEKEAPPQVKMRLFPRSAAVSSDEDEEPVVKRPRRRRAARRSYLFIDAGIGVYEAAYADEDVLNCFRYYCVAVLCYCGEHLSNFSNIRLLF